jgi:hypothetical protein
MKFTISQKNIGRKPFEKFNKDELGVQNAWHFANCKEISTTIYLVEILGSGYVQIGHFDYPRHLF